MEWVKRVGLALLCVVLAPVGAVVGFVFMLGIAVAILAGIEPGDQD